MTPTSVATKRLAGAFSGPARRQDAGDGVRVLLVASLLGGAAVHAAVVRQHLDHWPAAGLFFILLAVGGLAVGTALLRRADALRLLAALAFSVGPVLVWLVSRTAGLPFGPEAGQPEPVALADAAACVLALIGAGAALVLLRAAPGRRARALPAAAQLVTLGLIAVVTVVGLTGATLAHPAQAEGPPHENVSGEHSVGVGVEDGQHI